MTLMDGSLRKEFKIAMMIDDKSHLPQVYCQTTNIHAIFFNTMKLATTMIILELDGKCESVTPGCIFPNSLEWLMAIFHIIVSLMHIDVRLFTYYL